MNIRPFQHPDLCPKSIPQRVTDRLLNLLFDSSAEADSALCQSFFPNKRAYRSAVSRLRKDGLIALRNPDGKTPTLIMTSKGAARVADVCRRMKPWPGKWTGSWHLITYDVPEIDRAYREALRAFLKEKRMGRLHKSAWITPHDIRAAYDDLVIAAGVDAFSFLLDVKTLPGRSADEIVRAAWDMDRLRDQHRWYLKVYGDNLTRAEKESTNKDALYALIREEQTAYTTVMSTDPLLPKPLWPPDYAGEKVWSFHRAFTQKLTALL